MKRSLKRLWAWFDDITGTSGALGPPLTHPVPRGQKIEMVLRPRQRYARGVSRSGGHRNRALQLLRDRLRPGLREPALYHRRALGRILRGMHYYGSTAMIILIGLHAIRVYLMAAYKYPRQVNWLSGVVLLLGTLLMAFTGQILRWDQGGFWTAVVARRTSGTHALIGNWLGHFILAGASPGGATLSRFFAAHVFFIPAVCSPSLPCIFIWCFTMASPSRRRRAGRSTPRTYKHWYHSLMEREGVPFWPDAAWRDLFFGCVVVLVIFMLAVIVGPPEIGKPPDPTIIQASPRPDWYFLWYFALLALIPNWSENDSSWSPSHWFSSSFW